MKSAMKLVLAFACMVAMVASAAGSTPGEKGAKKLAKLMKKSVNGVVMIGGTDYQDLILTDPRPYDTIVLLTAPVSVGCSKCP
jgi:hypothetical protein